METISDLCAGAPFSDERFMLFPAKLAFCTDCAVFVLFPLFESMHFVSGGISVLAGALRPSPHRLNGLDRLEGLTGGSPGSTGASAW